MVRGLYLVTDASLPPERLFETVEQALQGGAAMVQFRDKSSSHELKEQTARNIQATCARHGRPFIVNDDIELAIGLNADGIHLGRDDASLTEARQQLGDQAIIGISCYGDIDLAIAAEAQGASYVAFGSFFASPSKPRAPENPVNLLREARAKLRIPICAIGGIMVDNAPLLIDAGADLVAVISAISRATHPFETARQISALFSDQR